jgi:hypothetical protein
MTKFQFSFHLVPALGTKFCVRHLCKKNYTVTGNTFCFGFKRGSGRIGSGSRQSGCPTTKGTISVITGNTDRFLHPGNGIWKDTGPGWSERRLRYDSCNTSGTGPRSKNSPGTYIQISSILAPIDHSGATFCTNSAKCSTIVLGIPLFEVRLVIGGCFTAENHR